LTVGGDIHECSAIVCPEEGWEADAGKRRRQTAQRTRAASWIVTASRRTIGAQAIRRNRRRFTTSRGAFDGENHAMNCAIRVSVAVLGLALACPINAAASTVGATAGMVLAQAMVPPTGMMDAHQPTPMEQRYLHRFPQLVRVGSLIGLPVLDLQSSTIGYVREVVRTPQDRIELIVSYSRWWGWFGRLVAVPLELVGIEGRQLVSLDMSPSQYRAAPSWQQADGTILSADATIRVALGRN
jgi:hypothetical protein